MALRYIRVQQQQGWLGENSDWPADMLPPGQLSSTSNVYSDGPELLRRAGEFREPNAQASAGLSLVAGFAANYSTGQKIIVQGANGRFYHTSAGMTTFAAIGTSAYHIPAVFAQLGDFVTINTLSGTMLGVSATDHAWSLASSAPSAEFSIAYKNRIYTAGYPASADTVFFTAIGATTGLPTITDWLATNNAGNRIFSQGEGKPLIGLAADQDSWYAFKRNRTFRVTGNTPQTFVTNAADLEAGFYHRSIANVGRGLVGCNEEGVFSVVNGKIEPLLPNLIQRWWNALTLQSCSAFQGAWSAQRNQYRLMVQGSGGTNEILVGVLEPGRPVGWYHFAVPAQCLFTRLTGASAMDFYRGGNADGYLLRMDQGTQDASATYTAFFESGILDDERPWLDKQFKRAWVFAKTRGAQNVSCTFRIHGEEAKPTLAYGTYRVLPLATGAGDVRRKSFHLGGQYGWGISVRVDFETSAAGAVHQIVIEYEDGRPGTATP